jgi:SHS2 domain-containing protein
MSWNYSFIDHTADIAVDIEADSLDELFIASALAWRESISEDKSSTLLEKRSLVHSENALEILLVSFLSELNFLFQSENWIMDAIHSLQIVKQKHDWNLKAVLFGHSSNCEPMILKAEIKAITYHQMEIKELQGKFTTRIVFDI